MAICPNCKAEIDYLRCFEKCWQEFRFTVDENGHGHYEDADNFIPCDENEYECRGCNTVLFYSHEDALNFLKGGSDADTADVSRERERSQPH